MFLASAGRIYSRKSNQEEFTRYVYDNGVLEKLKAAIICLYEIPIKPTNIEEFLAEFLENDAVDIVEISKLRAELCFKKSEAQEMRLNHEKLDKQIFEMEQRQLRSESDSNIEDVPHGTTSLRKMHRGKSYDRDGKQYEIMNRFFKDIQSFYPGALTRPNSIIFKEDEFAFGGEGEGQDESDARAGLFTDSTGNVHASDSFTEFVEDMKKFDPWGLVFPDIKKEERILRQTNRFPLPQKQDCRSSFGPIPNDGNKTKIKCDGLSHSKSYAELVRESRIDNLKSEREFRLNRKRSTVIDVQDEMDDDDDAKSIAELFHIQDVSSSIDSVENNVTNFSEAQGDPALDENDAAPMTFPCSTPLSRSDLYDWDVDYWSQFLREGDVLPKLGIQVGDTKTSIQGKQWSIPSKNVELQFFNPLNFLTEHDDAATGINATGSIVGLEPQHSLLPVEEQVQRIADNLKPIEIQDELTSQQLQLHTIWTLPRFTSAPITNLLTGRNNIGGGCASECATVYPESELEPEPEPTPTTPAVTTAGTTATTEDVPTTPRTPSIANASSNSTKSTSISIPHSMHEKEIEDVIDTDVVFGDPPLLCGKHWKKKTSSSASSGRMSKAKSGLSVSVKHLSIAAIASNLQAVKSKQSKGADHLKTTISESEHTSHGCRNRDREVANAFVLNYEVEAQIDETRKHLYTGDSADIKFRSDSTAKKSSRSKSRLESDASGVSTVTSKASYRPSGSERGSGYSGKDVLFNSRKSNSILSKSKTKKDSSDSNGRDQRLFSRGSSVKHGRNNSTKLPRPLSETVDEDEAASKGKRSNVPSLRGHTFLGAGSMEKTSEPYKTPGFDPYKTSKCDIIEAETGDPMAMATETTEMEDKASKQKKRSERADIKSQFRHSKDRNSRVVKIDPKAASMTGAPDPCDLVNIEQFHPYPELLYQSCIAEDESKEGLSRFARFCQEHYDGQVIDQILEDYDIGIFDNM